jgi:membrane protein YqaA with SNARE-associated domain
MRSIDVSPRLFVMAVGVVVLFNAPDILAAETLAAAVIETAGNVVGGSVGVAIGLWLGSRVGGGGLGLSEPSAA